MYKTTIINFDSLLSPGLTKLTVNACMATNGTRWFSLLAIERKQSFDLQQN